MPRLGSRAGSATWPSRSRSAGWRSWRSAGGPRCGGESALAPAGAAFEARLARLVGAGVVLGIVAGAAAVVLQAAVAGETSAWTALDPSVVREVLGTRTGLWLGIRFVAWLALAAALAALWARPSRGIRSACRGTRGRHRRGPGARRATRRRRARSPCSRRLDIVHVGATALWIGGDRGAAARRAGRDSARRVRRPARGSWRACSHGSRRSRCGRSWRWRSPAACRPRSTSTGASRRSPTRGSGGRLVKIGLFVVLVALGATQRRRIIPALRSHAAAPRRPAAPASCCGARCGPRSCCSAASSPATAVLVGCPPPRAVGTTSGNAGPCSRGRRHRAAAAADDRRSCAGPGVNELHIYLLDRRTGAPFRGRRSYGRMPSCRRRASGRCISTSTRPGQGTGSRRASSSPPVVTGA